MKKIYRVADRYIFESTFKVEAESSEEAKCYAKFLNTVELSWAVAYRPLCHTMRLIGYSAIILYKHVGSISREE